MKHFFSSKNSLTIIVLWSIVLLFIGMLVLNIKDGTTPIIPTLIISLVTVLIVWILFDTRYVIKNSFLFYRSGPIRGRIAISKIKSIKTFSGLSVPVMLKPALDIKGFIITYNQFDDLFVSPKMGDSFLEEIKKINPNIQFN